MINHGRTLLLNRPRNGRPSNSFPGEELIPADYRPVAYPSWIVRYMNVLFGRNSSALFVNQRLAQILTVMHSVEDFADYITELDSRITYRTDKIPVSMSNHSFNTLSVTSNSPGSFNLVGEITADVLSGRSSWTWKLEALSSGTVRATDQRTGDASDTEVTITGGLTNVISLPGSDAGVTLSVPSLTAGYAWTLKYDAELNETVTDLLRRLNGASRQDKLNLFGTAAVEPYLTFFGLYEHHFNVAHRLFGVIAALMYRCEEARVGNG